MNILAAAVEHVATNEEELRSDESGRHRSWCFTLNNYSEEERSAILGLAGVSYLVIGREVGENGTPHLQGFVKWRYPIGFAACRLRLPRAHLEVVRSLQHAIDYCMKDGDYEEVGVRPLQGKRNDLEEVCKLVLAGEPMATVASEHPTAYVKFSRGLISLRHTTFKAVNHTDTRGFWYWGPPGTGKSRFARDNNEDAYIKSQNKWWDGYDGQTSVILDDLDKGGICLGHHLKIWSDRYACTGEVKGASVPLQHTKFIVTSNYSIEQLWGDDKEMCAAIRRRFVVIYFGDHIYNPFNAVPRPPQAPIGTPLAPGFNPLDETTDDEIDSFIRNYAGPY